jgi:filamentous hemagglutinin
LQSLVNKDFLVNQGRVFTLGGGDITLVSQYGDIDAGKGAKTAQSTPPPVIRTDANGNTIVDISGSISGSGIATLRTAPDVPASSVYPIAPRGIFDAGDAGVRSTGSVNIVAVTVLNASNISAAGTVSGTNTTETSALSGAISAPANTTQTRTEDIAKSMETQSASAGGTLNVEVIGFGGDQQSVTQTGQNSSSPAPCKANDEECKQNRK